MGAMQRKVFGSSFKAKVGLEPKMVSKLSNSARIWGSSGAGAAMEARDTGAHR